jgi:hypothetical protein
MTHPLDYKQDNNYDKIKTLITLVVSVGLTAVTFAPSYNEPVCHMGSTYTQPF